MRYYQSRNIPEKKRYMFQGILIDQMNVLNRKDKNLISNYTVTLGDELQAVFNSADELFFDIVIITGIVIRTLIKALK